MAASKKGSKALNKSIAIKLSDEGIASLATFASEYDISKTQFIRDAIEEKINRIQVADEVAVAINAGIARIEEVARRPQILNDVIARLEALERAVVTRDHFTEQKKEISLQVATVETTIDAIKKAYITLDGNIKRALNSHVNIMNDRLENIDITLAEINPRYRDLRLKRIVSAQVNSKKQ